MANYVEAEYQKLKGLVEILGHLAERAQGERLLHDAEMAIKGNMGNPEALDILERQLRNVTVGLLSQLEGI